MKRLQRKSPDWEQRTSGSYIHCAVISLALMCLLLLLCACVTREVLHGERRIVTPVLSGPIVSVACELDYYVVGELREPSSLPVLVEHAIDLDKPIGLLKMPDKELRWAVIGLVLRVVQPAEYSGKILTAHLDGPSDPFEACVPGKRYIVNIPPKWIQDTGYKLCW